MGTVYATPQDLWQLALPPATLYGKMGLLTPGSWTDPTLVSGTGLGSISIWEDSSPILPYTVRVKVVTAGEINQDGYVNPGAVPRVRISLDGGTTYSRALTPDENGRVDFVDGGFGLIFHNGTAGAPVTVGLTNAALAFTPVRAGGSVTIIGAGDSLSFTFQDGALVLVVTSTTTSAQAAAFLNDLAAVNAYMVVAAGGDGSGMVQPATKTLLPFQSFVANDVLGFSTTASPDILSALQVASDMASGYLQSVFALPLLSWGYDLRQRVCELARWYLLIRKGLDSKQDFQIYNVEGDKGCGAMNWMRGVAQGQIRPHVDQTPPGATPFPLLVQPLDPLGWESGNFPGML